MTTDSVRELNELKTKRNRGQDSRTHTTQLLVTLLTNGTSMSQVVKDFTWQMFIVFKMSVLFWTGIEHGTQVNLAVFVARYSTRFNGRANGWPVVTLVT